MDCREFSKLPSGEWIVQITDTEYASASDSERSDEWNFLPSQETAVIIAPYINKSLHSKQIYCKTPRLRETSRFVTGIERNNTITENAQHILLLKQNNIKTLSSLHPRNAAHYNNALTVNH
jgi:hypothetical protein